jgi:carboxymethylenebutenolidase
MDQKFISLFDRFTHGGMNRREFMEKLTILAGSTTAATALLPILENNYAHANILPEGDPRIVSESLAYAGGAGYFAKPSAEGKYPGVLVIHENRGLNPHIKDVARRMAAEGFAALAPDYLSDLGGTPEDADKARDMIGTLKPDGINASSSAALAAVKAKPCLQWQIRSHGLLLGRRHGERTRGRRSGPWRRRRLLWTSGNRCGCAKDYGPSAFALRFTG